MAESTELIPQTKREMMNKALEFFGTITSVVIKTEEENLNAAELNRKVKGYISDLEADRKELVGDMDKQVRSINSDYKTVRDKLDNAGKKISEAMGAYHNEKLRIAAAEQAKRDAEAAEIRRKADEAALKELEKAQDYELQGRQELADKAMARAEEKIAVSQSAVAPVAAPSKPAGVSFRTDYVVEILNKATAVKAMIVNPVYAALISIDIPKLQALAKTLNGKLGIPCVQVTTKQTPITRTK
jgi:hypothetical protein